MTTYLRTAWNILKYILIHFIIMVLYIMGASFFYGIKMDIGGSVEDIENLAANMANHTSIAIIVAAVGSFLIYRYMMKRRGLNLYKECRFKRLTKGQILASCLIGSTVIFLSMIILNLTGIIFPQSLENHSSNMESIITPNTLLIIASVGIAAPLIEEILFRGLIFRELERKTTMKLTIIVQALLFGIYHLNLAHSTMAAVMGIFLGLSLYWTESIWAPILIHLINNLLSAGLELLGYSGFVELYPLVNLAMYGAAIFIVLPLSLRYLYRTRTPWESYGLKDEIESEVGILPLD